MGLPLLEKDLAYISKLDTYPNDVGGMSAEELKAAFDAASQDIQNYINRLLIPQIESDIDAASQGISSGVGIDGERLNDNSVPDDKIISLDGEKIEDGTIGTEKHKKGSITRELLSEDAKTVQTEDLPNNVVPGRALADNSIPHTKYGDGSIKTAKYEDGSITTPKIANGAVTRAKLGADAKVLVFTNKTIATSAWASNSTYSGFGFRASVACTGVTANFCPFVIFSPADAQSGKFAPVAVTYSGGVYIYASSKPTATVTIPTILCIPTA